MLFKPGDKVVRTAPTYAAAKQGEVYTVDDASIHELSLKEISGKYLARSFARALPETDPYAERAATVSVPGRKDDGGKLDVTLFFDDLPHAIEAVTEVLQWAVTKKQPTPYQRGSWQGVPDFQRRYRAATLRHLLNRAKGKIDNPSPDAAEVVDPETGLLELAHIATDALFQLEMAVRKQKGLPVPEGA